VIKLIFRHPRKKERKKKGVEEGCWDSSLPDRPHSDGVLEKERAGLPPQPEVFVTKSRQLEI